MSQTDISSQMLKGILQGCLLILINQRPYYGYAISQELSKYGFADIPKGTIYPVLTSMEKKGLILGKIEPSKGGPQRKYYYITDTGKQARKVFLAKWNILSLSVNDLINERRSGFMNSDKLINENNQLRENLNSENKRYYEDLLVYIRSKSTFNSEKDVEQLLLDMLHDLIDAQSNGESAEFYFGRDPKSLADEILKTLPKLFLIFLR